MTRTSTLTVKLYHNLVNVYREMLLANDDSQRSMDSKDDCLVSRVTWFSQLWVNKLVMEFRNFHISYSCMNNISDIYAGHLFSDCKTF